MIPCPSRCTALLALVSLAPWGGYAQPPRTQEYELKARILFLLMNYVTWPERRNLQPQPFRVLVLGQSPFGNHLQAAFASGKVQKRPVALAYARHLATAQLDQSDVIFICESESERLEEILRSCKGRSILLVGDTPDFAQRGIMVNLIIRDALIQPEVNLPATRQAGIEISSAFLTTSRARIIGAS